MGRNRPNPPIGWIGPWRRDHNNIRYAELLARLDGVTAVRLPYRWWHWTQALTLRLSGRADDRALWRLTIALANRRFDRLLVTADGQLAHLDAFRGRVVVDQDDPDFSDERIARLNRPSVAAVVTTSEQLRCRFLDAGLTRPCVVIPSGVALETLPPAGFRRDSADSVVVGFVTPRLITPAEAGADREKQLRSIGPLWEIMQRVWEEEPSVALRLVGQPSAAVAAWVGHHPRVRLLGYVPHADLLPIVAAFDIALYPRAVDFGGRHSIKLLEYMACGVPVVTTAVGEAYLVQQAGGGVTAADSAAFAAHVVALARDPARRAALGAAGRRFVAAYDWRHLAARYRREVLDRFLI